MKDGLFISIMKYFLLKKEQIVDCKFIIKFQIRKDNDKQTYRAIEIDTKKLVFLTLFLKLRPLDLNKITSYRHPNLLRYISYGSIPIKNNEITYLCTEFISGENLVDKIERESALTEFQSENIILSILNTFKFLHGNYIAYNEFNPINIMISMVGESEIIKIKDLDNLRFLSQDNFDPTLNLLDIGRTWYYLLTGEEKDTNEELELPSFISNKTAYLIEKLLGFNSFSKFHSVNEVIQEIKCDIQPNKRKEGNLRRNLFINKQENKKGRFGFLAIAGMQELKQTIQTDIIDALNNKEKYAEYDLTIPNGMLLYGPPGCGKTFFAEKMAEEIGATFYQLKPSDIQSKWVNASQENVSKLFSEAQKSSPSIIFIDELDAILPSRDTDNITHMNTTVVNEFLAQMNNCSEKGIFIIGATNRPLAIDSAILRSGRLDKHIYLPPPDYAARKIMFELYLKNRPIDNTIDYAELAKLTENFVSSDIKFLCDEAARTALKNSEKITQNILEKVISQSNSSLSLNELEEYEKIREKFSNKKSNDKPRKNKIGFF